MSVYHKPPKWMLSIFRWYCPDEVSEEIEGDLLEMYRKRCDDSGKANAKIRFLIDTIKFCNPTTFQKARAIRKPFSKNTNLADMIKHYFVLIFRNFKKHPSYNLLTLFGLVASMLASILIVLYINFELNFDLNHERVDQIYRVDTKTIHTHSKDIAVDWSNTPANLGPYMKQDYPEVVDFVRFYQFYQGEALNLVVDRQELDVSDIYAVDKSVFDIFTIDLIQGNALTALEKPNCIIISQKLARQLFGYEDPIGKSIQTSQRHQTLGTDLSLDLKVTGVYRDWPNNVHMPVEGMISSSSDPALDDYYFNRFGVATYVLLHETSDAKKLGVKFSNIYLNYLDPARDPVLKGADHELIGLAQIHLASTDGMKYVIIFAAVAVLMLLIATISYINMCTAQASKRILEIGIRKVLGSKKRQLYWQIFIESTIYTFVALLFSIVLLWSFGNEINNALALELEFSQLLHPGIILILLSTTILIGLLGGSYPAIFLSRTKPMNTLNNSKLRGASIRKWLMSIQFMAVIFVLISTGMIYEQLKYTSEKDLGFNQEAMLRLSLTTEQQLQKWPVLKEKLLENSTIASVASSSFIAGRHGMIRAPFSANGSAGPDPQFVRFAEMDYDYLSTMGIDLIQGRNFSRAHPSDIENAVIVNAAFVKNFGLSNPIGAHIRRGDSGNPNYLVIIGVINDFHHASLHEPIASQLFFLGSGSELVIQPQHNSKDAFKHAQLSFANLFPDDPVDISFLSDTIRQSYVMDEVRAKIFVSFTFITILVAFMGLFGLSAYLAKQRTKEIGIRKTFGCGEFSIIKLITKDFILILLTAILPAFVLAWYTMNSWLTNFAYQVDMNYWIFMLSTLFAMLFTLITTGIHAFNASKVNPAEALRS